jgi:hypothetical protein
MFSNRFQCRSRYCGSEEGYRSRRRTFLEKYFLPLFLLRPVRCASCFRRSYACLWVHVSPAPRRGHEQQAQGIAV